MNLSLNWLGRYVDIADLDPFQIVQEFPHFPRLNPSKPWLGGALSSAAPGRRPWSRSSLGSSGLSSEVRGPYKLPATCSQPHVTVFETIGRGARKIVDPHGILAADKLLGTHLGERYPVPFEADDRGRIERVVARIGFNQHVHIARIPAGTKD